MNEKPLVICDLEERGATNGTTQIDLMKEIVAQVRLDSQRGTEEYLDETTVPHGGE